MKWSACDTRSRERNKKKIKMEDIANSDIEYINHNGNDIQKPHNVALTIE